MAVDDSVTLTDAVSIVINVLENDLASSGFNLTAGFDASGNSAQLIPVVNAPSGMIWYWLQTISNGSGTVEGGSLQFTFTGFSFSSANWSDVTFSGGTVTFAWEGMTHSYDDVSFHGSMDIDYSSPHFGDTTATLSGPGLTLNFDVFPGLFPGLSGSLSGITGSGTADFLQSTLEVVSVDTTDTAGTAQINADNTVTFFPDNIEPVLETAFTYTVRDATGATDDAMVTVRRSGVLSIAGTADGVDPPPGFAPAHGRFTVSQGAAFSVDTVVQYQVGGTAAPGYSHHLERDYDALTGTVTIIAGQTSAVIDIHVYNENEIEELEEVTISLLSITSSHPGLAIDSQMKFASIDILDQDGLDPPKIDLDIDSDNNNGFNYPDNSLWEEQIEDHGHALGKLLFVADTHYTPLRLRLDPGMDPGANDLQIRLEFTATGQSGAVKLWNTFKADPNRGDESVTDGGSRLLPHETFTLEQLNYDPLTGAATLFIEAIDVWDDTHDTWKQIKDTGKPDDRVRAVIVILETDFVPVDGPEEVKYMVVESNTFYPNLQNREELRNAMASDLVYGPSDGRLFALDLLDAIALEDLGIPPDVIALVGQPESVPGFKSAVYRDYISGKYVLAFAGTDPTDLDDWINNAMQGLGYGGAQYTAAMSIAHAILNSEQIGSDIFVITGHSLGGGLASAASIVTGVHADTFNASGLRLETLQNESGQDLYPGASSNFESADTFVTAYYLDYDLLHFLQTWTPMEDAIGFQVELDGSLDVEVNGALFIATIAPNPLTWASALGGALAYMGLAHTMTHLHYGLMVLEDWNGDILWDIYGESFY